MKPAEVTSDHSVYLLLLVILDQLKHQMTTLAENHGLSLMQAKTLHLLDPEIEAPMSSLSLALHCDASNVTGIADRLEQHGLVVRKQSRTDRRVMTLSLTPEGHKLRQTILHELTELETQDLSSKLMAGEAATLTHLLNKLIVR